MATSVGLDDGGAGAAPGPGGEPGGEPGGGPGAPGPPGQPSPGRRRPAPRGEPGSRGGAPGAPAARSGLGAGLLLAAGGLGGAAAVAVAVAVGQGGGDGSGAVAGLAAAAAEWLRGVEWGGALRTAVGVYLGAVTALLVSERGRGAAAAGAAPRPARSNSLNPIAEDAVDGMEEVIESAFRHTQSPRRRVRRRSDEVVEESARARGGTAQNDSPVRSRRENRGGDGRSGMPRASSIERVVRRESRQAKNPPAYFPRVPSQDFDSSDNSEAPWPAKAQINLAPNMFTSDEEEGGEEVGASDDSPGPRASRPPTGRTDLRRQLSLDKNAGTHYSPATRNRVPQPTGKPLGGGRYGANQAEKNPSHALRTLLELEPMTAESTNACVAISELLDKRTAYLYPQDTHAGAAECKSLSAAIQDPFKPTLMEPLQFKCIMVDGVVHVYDSSGKVLFKPPKTAKEYFRDLSQVMKVSSEGHVRTHCHKRLRLLRNFWDLYLQYNSGKEFLEQKAATHRDFYNCRKVDTHVHHSSCMNQKHLLRFIKSTVKKCPDEEVICRDGKTSTLKEVFDDLGLEPHYLNLDLLDMYAGAGNVKHRFDKFNLKYNPCGESVLREIFLKQDNLNGGKFLAGVTKQVFQDLEESKYQLAEYRLSIYGRKRTEWDTLSKWICKHELFSDNVVWLIQIPRLFNVYKKMGMLGNFQEMLDNIFLPLFEVTLDPSSHPEVDCFLKQVVGFDMVDDESKPEAPISNPEKVVSPASWSYEDNLRLNPPFSYYGYYIYANLYVLNLLRKERGMSTCTFRPHAGEAGALDHLGSAFLLADNIAHGTNLRKAPCLQYLYYISQIGISMSPLSNNSLFLDYSKSPFPDFFAKGMNITLSTDDPLQIHFTKEPLVEEYSIAAQVWRLTSCDICEIARNSVLISGFPASLKKHWVSSLFWKRGPEGNTILKTNVPETRLQYRKDMLEHEINLISDAVAWQQQQDETSTDSSP